MKKAVLREYLKKREIKPITFNKKETVTIDRDKFFIIEVEDVDGYKEGAVEELIKKNAKKAVELYEEEVVKPKRKKKSDK